MELDRIYDNLPDAETNACGKFSQHETCALSLVTYTDQPTHYAMLWVRFEQTAIEQLVAERNPPDVFLIEPLMRHLANKVRFTLSRIEETPAYMLTVDEGLKENVEDQMDTSDICSRIQTKLILPSESFRCDDEADIVVDYPYTRAIVRIDKTTPYWREGVRFATPLIVASALNMDETRYVYNARWKRKSKYAGTFAKPTMLNSKL
ncbi:hypothetical protein P879_07518 [Paragonimus westermani]|uniref:Uncharacterized protein n=1 Tax=Paragonimus westermani TaxID=34504 RepID=A0A8T0DQ30_9TREM|nr:hypothetical protein P879_07518 [Paragonimus westermani]